MSLLTTILVTLVAFEFFYIMYLETFATDSESTSRVFKIKREDLRNKNINVLFKNQGVYNGLLAVALLYGAFLSKNPVEIVTMLLIYIVSVATYGAITSDKMILLKQGGLAIVALITLLI